MKDLNIIEFNDVAKEHLEESTLYDKSYPIALAKFIKNCEPPITIALQGEWGSGKTTMMNMVKNELVNSDVDCMDFNAWLFSQFNLGDQLPLILLTHLSQQTGFNNAIKDTLSKLAVSAVHFIGKKAGGTDNFMAPFTPDDIKQLENLKKDFDNAVTEKLKNSGKKKLLIFIDDIDRVAPEKAVELLESIKLFCESKNCIFVLAVDYDVILKGACKKFGDDKGQAFFDKIIQVPFNMPIATNNFDKFMDRLTDNIIDNKSGDAEIEKISKLYKEISELTIGNNPRSIKRLLNSFVITDYVANEQGIYSNDEKTDNYVRAMLYSLLCIENNNSDAYTYIVKLSDAINASGVNGYISKIKGIVENKDGVDRKDFTEYVEVLSEDGYDFEILNKFIDILTILKGVDVEKIKKIFNVSSSAIKTDKNKSATYKPKFKEVHFVSGNQSYYGKSNEEGKLRLYLEDGTEYEGSMDEVIKQALIELKIDPKPKGNTYDHYNQLVKAKISN